MKSIKLFAILSSIATYSFDSYKMKSPKTVASILLLTAVFLGAVESRESTYERDLYTPVKILKNKLDAIDSFNLTLLVETVLELLQNCTDLAGEGEQIETILYLTESLVSSSFIEFDDDGFNTQSLIDDIGNYMNSPHFEVIHNHLWYEDPEWNDMIKMFYEAKWSGDNSIYKWFKELYNFFGCTLVVPDGPLKIQKPARKSSLPTPHYWKSHVPIDDPNMLSLFAETNATQCNLIKIIIQLLELDVLQVAGVAKFVLRQIDTNPSVHLFWAKLSEPAKGASFRNTRSLKEVKCLINHWNAQLMKTDLMKLIVNLIDALLGINFDKLDINTVSLLISYVEYVIWKTPFPITDPSELFSCIDPK